MVHLKAQRKETLRLKDQGEALVNFHKGLGPEYENVQAWPLLPTEEVKSPLDENTYLGAQT